MLENAGDDPNNAWRCFLCFHADDRRGCDRVDVGANGARRRWTRMTDFAEAKRITARHYAERTLPQTTHPAARVEAGAGNLMALAGRGSSSAPSFRGFRRTVKSSPPSSDGRRWHRSAVAGLSFGSRVGEAVLHARVGMEMPVGPGMVHLLPEFQHLFARDHRIGIAMTDEDARRNLARFRPACRCSAARGS